AGTLQAGVANVIASSGSLALSNVAGAVFDLNSLNQSIGTLSGGGATGGNITLGSATLTVTQGSNQTYGGLISDGGSGGSLTKAGASRLTLSHANSYTGATSIQAGTLQAGIANIIASSGSLALSNVAGVVFDLNNFNQTIGTLSGGGVTGGNITLGTATLTVTQGSNQTYGGLISDGGSGGSLTKAGASRLTLSQATSYTGATSIQAGTLQAGVVNVISSSGSLALSNVAGAVFDLNSLNQTIGTLSGGGTTGGNISLGSATLTVAQSSDQTYGGSISGSGKFVKTGSAQLTLTGSNTYTGLTTVDGGTLQGNTSSLPGDIDNYHTLIWNQTQDGTYSHNITQSMGPGVMQVQGGGMLTATGSLTQDTITILNGGSMAIDGTATATTITVDSGGYLIGQGSVTGNIDVFGSLGAGHDIGTLSVTGSYTQESGSTFVVQIIPTKVDLLDVTNTITLGDHVATFVLMPTPGNYPANQEYTVMHGAGGVSGRFIEPIVSTLPSFTATLHYTPLPSLLAGAPSVGDPGILYVILLVNTVTPSHLPVSPSALIAAQCFDGIPNNPFAEFLLFMQIPQMNATLTAMLPSFFGTVDLVQQRLITQVREVATREMNFFLKNPCGSPQRFRIWADVFLPHAIQRARQGETGYDAESVGEALGFDCQVTPNSFLGAFVAYTHNHTRGKGVDADFRMHNIYGNLYAGGWISPARHIYAQAVVSGSYDDYHTVRSIFFEGEQFNAFTKQPKAHFHGMSGLGSFEVGKLWKKGFQNQLYGRVDYAFNDRAAFQEYGASSLNLDVQSHFSDFIRMELGDSVSRCITWSETDVDVQLAAGGVLEYQINGAKQKASFAGTPCVMVAKGPTLHRAFLFWEAGIEVHTEKNYIDVIAGHFRGEYGGGFVSHNWSIELRSSF
ncbi:MAG: autotransporter-associated beta strand repeat-containing protein, partial [Verrucomicrobiota bacterium]|nr:autotransporter-associated beta strand repeat-containing protein [Verrucomicrobiota bacterium]